MKPDIDDLVGANLAPEERARLERVHELLLAVGPPPETVPAVPAALQPRRRRGALLALAATLAASALAFALGAALADGSAQPHVDRTLALEGTAAAPEARASLVVFDIDGAGNWPMELTVDGLPPAPGGQGYELWLTRAGKLAALCGSFLTDDRGSAVVPMNAPYRFDEFDGWVIVVEGYDEPHLTT